MSKETKPFSYFDSPDGEDVPKKLGCILKPVTLTALGMSTIDVLLYSHPKGYLQTLGRFIHFSWPIFGSATTFVITHNMAASWRKKDDPFNWFIGGAAAGAIFGIWRKCPMTVFNLAMGFGAIAAGTKYSVQNGYVMFPTDSPVEYGGLWSSRQDWSLMRHIPGNWTTGK